MDKDQFITNYLTPATPDLNPDVIHPLPDIAGLKKEAEFIIQCEQNQTFSINVIKQYNSDSLKVRLVDVYKNTQRTDTKSFIRLVGTMSLYKHGFPFVFLDAALSNVNPFSAQPEELTTRVMVHAPQTDTQQQKIIFDKLNEVVQDTDIETNLVSNKSMPDFWSQIWLAKVPRLDLQLIKALRDQTWSAYEIIVERGKEDPDFDYASVRNHLTINQSKSEHLLFKKLGFTVPHKAQSAFFGVFVSD